MGNLLWTVITILVVLWLVGFLMHLGGSLITCCCHRAHPVHLQSRHGPSGGVDQVPGLRRRCWRAAPIVANPATRSWS